MASSRYALWVRIFLAASGSSVAAQEVSGPRVRYEMNRATVYFENGAFSPEEMGRFALLADRGITDIDHLLNHTSLDLPGGSRVTFMVRDQVQISRSFRRTVVLPGDRVRRQAAPYLHETTHVLVPMQEECLWLSEGFASYVQSYVAERIGGYDGYVFSWGGNQSIDRLARRTLNSEAGKAALPYVGSFGEPENLFEDRTGVAQPLYVLAHSLVKFMIETAGLDQVKALVQSANIVKSAEPLTGRTIDAWKTAWLAMLTSPRAERTSGSQQPWARAPAPRLKSGLVREGATRPRSRKLKPSEHSA